MHARPAGLRPCEARYTRSGARRSAPAASAVLNLLPVFLLSSLPCGTCSGLVLSPLAPQRPLVQMHPRVFALPKSLLYRALALAAHHDSRSQVFAQFFGPEHTCDAGQTVTGASALMTKLPTGYATALAVVLVVGIIGANVAKIRDWIVVTLEVLAIQCSYVTHPLSVQKQVLILLTLEWTRRLQLKDRERQAISLERSGPAPTGLLPHVDNFALGSRQRTEQQVWHKAAAYSSRMLQHFTAFWRAARVPTVEGHGSQGHVNQEQGSEEHEIKELVLLGGGHAHVYVLKSLGLHPLPPWVRVTLISREVMSPYSGMIPGHIAGWYTKEECHIDLPALCRFAGARFLHASACGLEPAPGGGGCVLLEGPGASTIPYHLLSINVGSTPQAQGLRRGGVPVAAVEEVETVEAAAAAVETGAAAAAKEVETAATAAAAVKSSHTGGSKGQSVGSGALSESILSGGRSGSVASGAQSVPAVTPVKPIDGFSERWDQILSRLAPQPPHSEAVRLLGLVRLVVVGGGAGGVELALSMQVRSFCPSSSLCLFLSLSHTRITHSLTQMCAHTHYHSVLFYTHTLSPLSLSRSHSFCL